MPRMACANKLGWKNVSFTCDHRKQLVRLMETDRLTAYDLAREPPFIVDPREPMLKAQRTDQTA